MLRGRAKDNIPAGTMWLYYGTSAPAGWLFCDGQSTSGYPALAAAVGGNVPDMRGRAPIGVGQGSGLTNRTLNSPYGAESVGLVPGNMPSHSHGGGGHKHGLHGHTHTVGLHGHNGNSHSHGAGHGHTHAHAGIVNVGTVHQDWHRHYGAWEQCGSNPGGYFTGLYADSGGSGVGWASMNTASAGLIAQSIGASGPNNINANAYSGTIIATEGSGAAVTTMPPALALHFIIKT